MKKIVAFLVLAIYVAVCYAQNELIVFNKMKEFSHEVYQVQNIYYVVNDDRKVCNVLMSQTVPSIVKQKIESLLKGLPPFAGTQEVYHTFVVPTEENLRKEKERFRVLNGVIVDTFAPKDTSGGTNYEVIEQMPSFPGGINALMTFLSNNIRYPMYCEEFGVESMIIMSFIVEKDGSISSITTVSGNDYFLEKEAERVIKLMPNWIPGRTKSGTVKVKYSLPITFRLR